MDVEGRAKLQTVGGALALVVLVAAGGWLLGRFIAADDNSQSDAAPRTTTMAPVDPEAETKAEIEGAYRAYLAMQERLQLTPNPDDPEIPQRTTGAARERIRAALADLDAKGQAIRVGPATSQTVLSIEIAGEQATVTACFVDESGIFDVATGAEVVPMHIGTEIDRTVLERDVGTWRVSARKAPHEGEVWEGETTCDR